MAGLIVGLLIFLLICGLGFSYGYRYGVRKGFEAGEWKVLDCFETDWGNNKEKRKEVRKKATHLKLIKN